jgi:hypothetical protein
MPTNESVMVATIVPPTLLLLFYYMYKLRCTLMVPWLVTKQANLLVMLSHSNLAPMFKCLKQAEPTISHHPIAESFCTYEYDLAPLFEYGNFAFKPAVPTPQLACTPISVSPKLVHKSSSIQFGFPPDLEQALLIRKYVLFPTKQGLSIQEYLLIHTKSVAGLSSKSSLIRHQQCTGSISSAPLHFPPKLCRLLSDSTGDCSFGPPSIFSQFQQFDLDQPLPLSITKFIFTTSSLYLRGLNDIIPNPALVASNDYLVTASSNSHSCCVATFAGFTALLSPTTAKRHTADLPSPSTSTTVLATYWPSR